MFWWFYILITDIFCIFFVFFFLQSNDFCSFILSCIFLQSLVFDKDLTKIKSGLNFWISCMPNQFKKEPYLLRKQRLLRKYTESTDL
jgi:hypothetical protein